MLAACGASNAPAPQGETAAQRAFDDATAPDVTPRDLGALPPGECGTQAFIAAMGATCKRLDAKAAESSGGAPESHAAASDADACTMWNSGGLAPQFIGIDLGKNTEMSGMLLIPDSTPPEIDAVQRIEVSGDNTPFRPLVDVKAHEITAHGYAVTFPTKVTARFVRVTTESTRAYVSWREIAAVTCP